MLTFSPRRQHLWVALSYLLLAFLLWWPLPLHLSTHVPGTATWAFDEYTFVWNLWWFRHALLGGLDPLHSDFIFHPLGIDLVLYTYNLLNALLALPLLGWLSPALASNLILIAMSVLSGWGTWLLVRWLVARTLGTTGVVVSVAAWGAGLLYAFGAYRAVYAALGHYDLVSTGFIPLFTLFFLKTLWGTGRPAPSRWVAGRPAVLTGVFMAAALLNEMIFGVFLAMLGLILMALTWRQFGRGWVGRMLIAVGVAAVLWGPVGVPVVQTLLSTDYVLTGWGDALKLSADLYSFTAPTALHPLWGPDWVTELRNVQVNAIAPGTSRFSDVNTVFVGVSTLLLGAVALWRYGRRVAAWAVGLITFLILSLGPLLQVGGRYGWSFDNVLGNGDLVEIPLPFIILHYLPIVQGNRAANRFSVVLLLCAAVLVGYALLTLARAIQQRSNRRLAVGATAALGLLLLVEQLSFPLPLTDATIPAGYAQVRADPDDVAVLTLPLGWRNSFGVVGAENTRNQWYMVGHGKRLLQGNISRAPAFKFDYWANVPVIRSLDALQNDREVSTEQQADDADRALETMQLLGVRYVAVHPAVAGRPPYEQNRERTLAYLQDVLPMTALYEGDDLLLFRVDAPAPRSGTVDFGTTQSDLYQVQGWFGDEQEGATTFNWATQTATLLLPIADPHQPLTVTLSLRPFQLPQTVQPLAFERAVGAPLALEAGWNEIEFTVPPELLDGPTLRLTLDFSRSDLPSALNPQPLGTTGVTPPAAISVQSGGPGIGDLAWITVDGADASAHRNGTNVTVINPQTGAVEQTVGFDTTANEFERDRLHQFIADIPDGRIVAVALQGAATSYLDLDTVAALQTLGAANGPTAHAVSYVLLGVKGAEPGTALEQQSATTTAYVEFLPDDRALSSAVDAAQWVQP